MIMPRTYGLQTANDLLAKLERDTERLRDELSSDGFFNFVVTAYSLIDWVQNDPSVNSDAKRALEQFRTRNSMKACRDLANASKHFELNHGGNANSTVESAESEQGFGVGRFGKGPYGIGEEEIKIFHRDGTIQDGMELAESTLAEWKEFFTQHGIHGSAWDHNGDCND